MEDAERKLEEGKRETEEDNREKEMNSRITNNFGKKTGAPGADGLLMTVSLGRNST